MEQDLEIGCSAWAAKEKKHRNLGGVDEETQGQRRSGGQRESDTTKHHELSFQSPSFVRPRTCAANNDDDDDDDNDEEGEGDQSVEQAKEHSQHPPPNRPALRRMNRFRKRSSIVRRKSTVDIETGNAQEHVIECRTVDDELYFQPMKPSERWWRMLLRHKNDSSVINNSLQERVCQYRLTSRKTARGIWKYLKMAASEDFHATQGLSSCIADLLIWTFQTHFILVFVAASSLYIFFSLFFAILLYVAVRNQPDCIVVGGDDFNESGRHFMDVFSLSWQTITTAGFGAIYPSVQTHRNQYCVGLNMLTALESFWGVLFAGCITAIIFSKVVRVQAVAAVEFSDPIVVRYGTGVMPADDEDAFSEASSTDAETASRCAAARRYLNNSDRNIESMLSHRSLVRDTQIPCPILEFRLMNRLHDQVGGEVCNATVNVVAVTSASRASLSIRSALAMGNGHLAERTKNGMRERKRSSSIKKTIQASGAILRSSAYRATAATGAVIQKSGDALLRKSGAVLHKINQTLTSVPEAQSVIGPEMESLESLPHFDTESEREQSPIGMPIPVSLIETSRQHLAVDEEPSSSLVPRRIFSKLEIETDRHPFFKRVWIIRHNLNEHSPLLSNEAKRLIKENQGFWPEELNSYEKVRKHIHFHEIIVNFSGTSNVSGATVYSQRVYEFVDMNVGYRFANMLLKDDEKKLVVDARLLNDVLEQLGGGAEPLTNIVDTGLHATGEKAVDAAKVAARVTAGVALSSADAAARVTVGVAQTTVVAASTMVRATTGVAQTTASVAATVVATGLRTP